MDIESIILGLSYLGIFIMMISNGIFSFPSSQILYIITGYFVGRGYINLEYVIIAGTIGNVIGNIALYEITREHGPKAALKYIPGADRHLGKAEKYFAKKGIFYLFFAKLMPALKILVPIIAGVAKTPRVLYTILVTITSAVWAYVLIMIGLYFGKNTSVYEAYVPALLVVSAMLIAFFIYSYNKDTKERV